LGDLFWIFVLDVFWIFFRVYTEKNPKMGVGKVASHSTVGEMTVFAPD
jgi:hypothetical protein